MTEKDLGKIEAYRDMQNYARSMILTADDPAPWTDMALFAHAGIEDITDPIDIEDTTAVEF